MAKSVQQKTERSPEEAARLRELRERYQRERPSIVDLEARGAEFATLGEVVLLRCLAGELRRERERQGLPREQVEIDVVAQPWVVTKGSRVVQSQLSTPAQEVFR